MNDSIDQENRFPAEIESRMIEHMNSDHVEAMCDYCRYMNVSIGTNEPKMIALDQLGFSMEIEDRTVRYAFEHPCNTPEEVRTALVALAKLARSSDSSPN